MREAVNVMGCPITKLSLNDFVDVAEEFIASRTPHYIAVVNAAKIVKMRSDRELEQSVLSADLIGADGIPLVWASRLLGNALPDRVNGTDLMDCLLDRANQKGYGIFFFGAREEALQAVLAKVRFGYPGVKIAGFRNGYFNKADEGAIVQQIRKSGADILFIAFGT